MGSQYIVSLRVGSRVFQPKPFTTLLTVALLAMLIALGRWQLHRADEKRVLYDSFAAGTDATRNIDLAATPLPRYQHVAARGHYDTTRQILIDNMFNGEQVGYYVITPFALDGGGYVLVNRGWVPLGASRAELPRVPVDDMAREIHGRADKMPSPGIHLGASLPLHPPFPAVAAFPTRDEIAALIKENAWTGAADLVLLDAGEPDGYARKWSAPGFPPLRHVGYAVQWFGLALALFVIYLVTNLKRQSA